MSRQTVSTKNVNTLINNKNGMSEIVNYPPLIEAEACKSLS